MSSIDLKNHVVRTIRASTRLGTVRVGLVGEVGTGSAAGVARSTVLRLSLVVVVEASLHLVVVVERSVRAVLASTTEKLLAVGSAVLLVLASALGLAAADGEHPEETGSNGEGGGNSDASKESTVDVALNTNDRGDNENGGNTSDDPGQAGENARAVGEDAKNDLNSESEESCDVDNLSPLGNSPEGSESVLNLLGQLNLNILVGTNEVGGVQLLVGPVKLRLLALSLAILVGLAETPEVDVVVLVEAEQLSGDVVLDGFGTSLDLGHIADVQLEVLEVEVIDNAFDVLGADA
ncbi:hypothetical protein HG530_004536 [Fusarium avenaceum]|nr:hypothetical protein HG530_004536 [Fusarium avenaceum]